MIPPVPEPETVVEGPSPPAAPRTASCPAHNRTRRRARAGQARKIRVFIARIAVAKQPSCQHGETWEDWWKPLIPWPFGRKKRWSALNAGGPSRKTFPRPGTLGEISSGQRHERTGGSGSDVGREHSSFREGNTSLNIRDQKGPQAPGSRTTLSVECWPGSEPLPLKARAGRLETRPRTGTKNYHAVLSRNKQTFAIVPRLRSYEARGFAPVYLSTLRRYQCAWPPVRTRTSGRTSFCEISAGQPRRQAAPFGMTESLRQNHSSHRFGLAKRLAW